MVFTVFLQGVARFPYITRNVINSCFGQDSTDPVFGLHRTQHCHDVSTVLFSRLSYIKESVNNNFSLFELSLIVVRWLSSFHGMSISLQTQGPYEKTWYLNEGNTCVSRGVKLGIDVTGSQYMKMEHNIYERFTSYIYP